MWFSIILLYIAVRAWSAGHGMSYIRASKLTWSTRKHPDLPTACTVVRKKQLPNHVYPGTSAMTHDDQ